MTTTHKVLIGAAVVAASIVGYSLWQQSRYKATGKVPGPLLPDIIQGLLVKVGVIK